MKHVFPCRTCPSCNWGIRTQGDESELETGLKLPLTPNAAISAQQSPAKPSDFCGKWFPERLPDPCEFVDQLIQLIVRFQMKKQRHSEGKSESLVCVGCVAFSHLFSTKDVGRIWALDCAGQSKLLTELLGKASADAACSLQPEIFNAEHFLLRRSGRSDAQQLSDA